MNDEKRKKSEAFIRIVESDHLILLGQLGNMGVKLRSLRHTLEISDGEHFIPLVKDLEEELAYFRKIFPARAGNIPF